MEFQPSPLRDDTAGLLKDWPGGGVHFPDGTYVATFRPALPDESPVAIVVLPSDLPARMYCKYCYGNRRPLVLREFTHGVTSEMVICSECAYGLTPSAPTVIESLNDAPWIEAH